MHNLICMMLSDPDLLLEPDPVSDILQLWRNHGVRNVIVLNGVSIQRMTKIFAEALTMHESPSNGITDHAVLFDIPESVSQDEEHQSTHRMLLAIVDKSPDSIETILDETEKITQVMVNSHQNILFVIPLLHVRGF